MGLVGILSRKGGGPDIKRATGHVHTQLRPLVRGPRDKGLQVTASKWIPPESAKKLCNIGLRLALFLFLNYWRIFLISAECMYTSSFDFGMETKGVGAIWPLQFIIASL